MHVPPKATLSWDAPAPHAEVHEGLSASDAESMALDLDLDIALADSMAQQLAHVTAEQLSARLLRIERSVLRQERVSLEILVNMQKLVAASRRPRPDSAVD